VNAGHCGQGVAEGMTPLEVMLKAMRTHADKNEWDEAASMAKDAAPYMHAKLASIQHTGRNGGPIQTVDLTQMSGDDLDVSKLSSVRLPVPPAISTWLRPSPSRHIAN